MAKIGIIGATGMTGSAIYKEALAHNQKPTALVRNAAKAKKMFGDQAKIIEKDAFDLTADDLKEFDVVVDAFATTPDKASDHVKLAKKLVSLATKDGPRLYFILGAGSLIAGADGHLAVEDIKKVPGSDKWIAIPEEQKKELDYLRTVDSVNWVGTSPAMQYVEGPASEQILMEVDHLLKNDRGESKTTSGTMAKAVISEIMNPAHHNMRFTVANGLR